MNIHRDVLLGLANEKPIMTMKINGLPHVVEDATISYSDVPVTKPTTRGGVYFADKKAFKLRVRVMDPSLSAMLSRTMLGPNADFKTILFVTKVDSAHLTIHANLTNYVQKGDGLELNLVVVGTELSD
jgi:hypothetical protein